ncbi:hypothetical protein [Sinorhizobium meliloti]|uniref:hypothetical protein n=1 Tax=Rhizobium meliloti TaxID=382 RepID=UPI001F48CD16|nr:hypothetical protein [Sinorhizobium meliloti]
MTNIEASIICHPPIPLAHITPPETLVLTNALECSEIEAILVPFTDFGAMHPIRGRRHELNEAFRASAPHVDSAFNIFIASRIIALLPALSGDADTAASVDIDSSEFPGRSWCRGTVARSLSLRGTVVRRRRFLISTTNFF